MNKRTKNKIENKRANSEIKNLVDKMGRIFPKIERKQESVLYYLSKVLRFSKPVYSEINQELRKNTEIFSHLLKRLKIIIGE